MHTNFYQLRVVGKNYLAEELSELQISEQLGNTYIDYIDRYKKAEEEVEILTFLKRLGESGCEIDNDKKTFTIIDREKFLKFLLEDNYYWDFAIDDSTWYGRAQIADAVLGVSLCTIPCCFDECVYDSLFDALRHNLITNRYQPLTIEVLCAYDCHY